MNRVLKVSGIICFVVFFTFIGSVVLYRHLEVTWAGTTTNLLIAGSTTLNLFIQSLADEFQKRYPDIIVVTAGGGSTAGLIAVKKGAIDLGGMSRDLTGPEDDEHTKSFLIARDSVAVVVHKDNPITNLTREQVAGIFTGRIRDWSEIGGAPGSISVCIRDENSTTRGGFEELVMLGEEYCAEAKEFTSHDALGKAMGADPGSIGYYRAFWLNSALGANVKGVKIDGVEIQKAYILSGRYPLTRSLFLVTYGEPSETAQLFLDFARSPDGQKVMENRGAIPVY